MVHLDGLDFSGHVRGSEVDHHSSLDDTGLNTTDGHCANASNLVDILEGKTEGLVGRTDGGLNGIDSIEEGLALDDTSLGLLGPALEPRHANKKDQIVLHTVRIYDLLLGLFQHVVSVPSGDGDEGDRLGVVADLLDEAGGFLDNFVETVLAPLYKMLGAAKTSNR